LLDWKNGLQLFFCDGVAWVGRDKRGSPMTIALTHGKSAAARAAACHSSLADTASDDVLIRRIAAGDQLAMRTLFARHRIPLYRWLLRIVRDETLAEDLLSDVFLDVWRQAASFRGHASVSTWLLAIARYKALSARRARPHAELDARIASTIADPADDPEAALQKKNRSEMLRDSLASLSPEHGEVIDLVYYHGKSVKEVADIVGIGEATVKTRMFYARRKLADLVAVA
jgi:RNA polymerase sigma-70 factor, ECF subfamily